MAMVAGGGAMVELLEAALDAAARPYVTGNAATTCRLTSSRSRSAPSGSAPTRPASPLIDAMHYGMEKPPQLAMVEWFRARGLDAGSSRTGRSSGEGRAGRRAELVRPAEMRVALRGLLRRTEELAAEQGLTSQRYTLLLQIEASPERESTVGELTEKLHWVRRRSRRSSSAQSYRVSIERRRSEEDARVTLLRLTPEGARRMYAVFDALETDRGVLPRRARGPRRERARLPRMTQWVTSRLI